MKNPIKLAFLVAVLATASLPASRAATIVWGGPTSLSSFASPDPLAVDTTGTLLAAKKFGGTTDYTVNGVTFLDDETKISLSGGSFVGTYGFPIGTFATMLSTENSAQNLAATMTLSGLTNGQAYSVQIFTPIWNNANFPLTLTAGNTVTLANGFTGTSAIPQYVIGTFTADAGTQTISLTNPAPDYWTLSAAQVRVIPEPTTALMLLGGLAGAMLLRRRRTA